MGLSDLRPIGIPPSGYMMRILLKLLKECTGLRLSYHCFSNLPLPACWLLYQVSDAMREEVVATSFAVVVVAAANSVALVFVAVVVVAATYVAVVVAAAATSVALVFVAVVVVAATSVAVVVVAAAAMPVVGVVVVAADAVSVAAIVVGDVHS